MKTKKVTITKTKRKAPKPKLVKGELVQRSAQPYMVELEGSGKLTRREYYVSPRTASLGAVRMLREWLRKDHWNRRVRIDLPGKAYRYGQIQNVGMHCPKESILLGPIIKKEK